MFWKREQKWKRTHNRTQHGTHKYSISFESLRVSEKNRGKKTKKKNNENKTTTATKNKRIKIKAKTKTFVIGCNIV